MIQRAFNNLSATYDPTLPTLFFRKTENYGATWTGDVGDNGPLGSYGGKYFYLSDAVMTNLSDSLIQTWEGDSIKLNYQDRIYYEDDPRPFVPAPGFFFGMSMMFARMITVACTSMYLPGSMCALTQLIRIHWGLTMKTDVPI